MILGIVLLYVGAALLVNGIWLVGQARSVARPRVAELIPEMAAASVGGPGGAASAPAVPSVPTSAASAASRIDSLQGREIAVINIFTGGVGVVVAIVLTTLGAIHNIRTDVTNAALILLFAFTYLWIAANQFLNVSGRAFGWFCFFVAVTAVPTGVYVLHDAHGNAASLWLAADWFVWAVLWFLFFLLLALERPIGRLVGWVTIGVALSTAWAFGYSILQGAVTF